MKTKKISDLSLVELKAAAYDLIAQSEVIQRDLGIINNEIAKKTKEEKTDSNHE
jgi:hypothetical protein